eukprot:10730616-Ditylum_brightwellii.AAC.1
MACRYYEAQKLCLRASERMFPNPNLNYKDYRAFTPSQVITTPKIISNIEHIQRQNKIIGDTLVESVQGTTRVYFQNINGIKIADK